MKRYFSVEFCEKILNVFKIQVMKMILQRAIYYVLGGKATIIISTRGKRPANTN